MLKAKIERLEDHTFVTLRGRVDEKANLMDLIGFRPGRLKVNCRAISAMNSSGIRNWTRFFNEQRSHGSTLEFEEVSPCMVEVISILPNWFHIEDIQSIVVPFFCSQCKCERYGRAIESDISRYYYESVSITCKECSGDARFDGDLAAYKKFADFFKAAKIKYPSEPSRRLTLASPGVETDLHQIYIPHRSSA